MKQSLLITILLCCFTYISANDSILVEDNFLGAKKYIDNSLLTIWGSNTNPTTIFNKNNKTDSVGTTYHALSILSSALSYAADYSSPNGLKTLSSVDYELPLINRETNTIKIEFDALWDVLNANGEAGRIVVTAVYNYPTGGAKLHQVDSLNLVHPFGRPAYNMRIRNTINYATSYSKYNETSSTFMLYGGGKDIDGEFETITDSWWIPGFSSQAGGTAPGQPSYEDYPQAPTKKSNYPYIRVASKGYWKHITWIIEPEMMYLYQRKSTESENLNKLVSHMCIPKNNSDSMVIINKLNANHDSTVSALPLMYKWFPQVNAIRFYWRCNNQAYLANIKITKSTVVNSLEEKHKEENDIEVYPNPIRHGKIYLNIKNKEELRIQLTSLNGQILYKNSFLNKEQIELNVSEFPKGLYILSIFGNKINQTKKIVIN